MLKSLIHSWARRVCGEWFRNIRFLCALYLNTQSIAFTANRLVFASTDHIFTTIVSSFAWKHGMSDFFVDGMKFSLCTERLCFFKSLFYIFVFPFFVFLLPCFFIWLHHFFVFLSFMLLSFRLCDPLFLWLWLHYAWVWKQVIIGGSDLVNDLVNAGAFLLRVRDCGNVIN